MDDQSFLRKLNEGLSALAIELSLTTKNMLLQHLLWLENWNKRFNLTAICGLDNMLVKHVFDSLSILYFCKGKSVLDVGTGAGFPGIPLAVCLPQTEFVLLDAVKKKTLFVRHVIMGLGLTNIKVKHERVEMHQGCYDCIVARAFSSITKLVNSTKNLCNPNGVIIALKGKVLPHELSSLPSSVKIIDIVALDVPGLEKHERHAILLQCKQD